MKYYLSIFAIICLFSCAEFKFGAKGNFDKKKYSIKGKDFYVEKGYTGNNLKKLYEGPYAYYSWKTVEKNNIDQVSNSPYLSFRTINNTEIKDSEIADAKLFQTSSNLFENYLFFL